MKKTLLLLTFALFTASIHAQKNSEKAAAETCDCFNKMDIPDNISHEEYEKILTTCLEKPIATYYEKICKELKIAADNTPESYEAVGTKIGGKLVENCPKFMKMAVKAEENKNSGTAPKTIEEEGKEGSASGVVKSIDKKDFYYISIENTMGNKESFIWLRFFKGSTPFENNPASQVGKKIAVKYREIRCFSPDMGDYVIKKEITEITFVD
ncbi:MAG TPA: hypothetical protein VGF30_15725 [Bacteroidia bacterium]